MFKRIFFLLIFLYSIIFSAFPQTDRLFFEHISQNVNSPKSAIHGIMKDTLGFMWFGTWNGLYRYDGYNFITYRNNPGNPRSICSNRINNIYKDRDGTLWISTFYSDFCHYNYNTDDFDRYTSNQIPKYIADSLYRDENTSNTRVITPKYKWDIINDSLVQINVKTGASFAYNADILTPGELNDANVSWVYLDDSNILWIGTINGGVNKADLLRKSFQFSFNRIKKNSTIINTSIRVIYNDGQNLWLGTNNKGITVINHTTGKYKYFQKQSRNGIPNNNIRALIKDQKGNIWIGSHIGLDKYNSITGNVKAYIRQGIEPQLRIYRVHSLTEDHNGCILAGIFGGLAIYHPSTDKVTIHWLPALMGYTLTMQTIIDKRNNIWIATEGAGVICVKRMPDSELWMDTVKYEYIPENPNSLPGNKVYSLFEDEAGLIWIGTSVGLCCINPLTGVITRHTSLPELFDGYIANIQGDMKGNIWFSHKKGISCLNKKSKQIKNYTSFNGIHGYEFLDGSGFRNPANGKLYFGGENGYVSFFPDSIRDNPYPPKVVITELQVLNKPVAINQKINGRVILKKAIHLTNTIQFTYWDRSFSLEFAALHFSDPASNQYYYKLDGFDKDWIYTNASRRFASYSNLPSGKYIFKVKASNCDGIWNTQPATLEIVVLPPWWKTWWAYTIYFSFLFIMIFGVTKLITSREKLTHQIQIERIKAEKIEEVDRLKSQFFTNISHEFRTPLTLIIDPLERLVSESQENSKVQQYYNLMLRNAKRLLNLINQLLDFRKAGAGYMQLDVSIQDIVLQIKNIIAAFEFHAVQQNIKLVFNTQFESLQLGFDADKLDKILFNLIANAFKYTPDGGDISVDLTTSNTKEIDFVEIKIKDNGIGIPSEEIDKIFDPFYQAGNKDGGTGIGLALTKELVFLHKGHISVESEVGNGTCFTVLLPYTPSGNKQANSENHTNEIKAIRSFNPLNIGENNKSLPIFDISEEPIDNNAQSSILIIEDNADVRTYLTTQFAGSYQVIEAPDGIIGFEKATTNIPDLIISDIMMPGLNGLELCRKLKSDERTSHIPILLLTARQSDEYKIEGYETGADDYISKPFSTPVLLARVKNLIDSRRKLSEMFNKGSQFELKKIAINNTDEAFLNKAVKLIESSLALQEFNMDVMAEQLKMSKRQLYKKIKALTNKTVHDFITTIRLNKAAEMLLSGEHNIAEVAYKTGYSEPSNFTRSFQKQFGQSPSGFIKSFQK